MRILALTGEFSPFRGGIGTYAAEMARAAHELGHDIMVVAPDYGADQSGHDRQYGFAVLRYAGGPHAMRDLPAKTRLLRRLLGERDYDLVHVMDWPFLLPSALLARHKRRMVTLHGSDVLHMSGGVRRPALFATGALAGEVEFVANSAFTRNLFRAHFPRMLQVRSRFVHLGVNDAWRELVPKSVEARTALGLPPDRFVILTVGRLTPRKGQLEVVRALELLPAPVRERIFYAVAGPGDDPAYTRSVEAALAAAGFAGRRFVDLDTEQLRVLCRNADLFCLVGQEVTSGQIEGFGLAYLEAGSQELPSIAGDIGGVAEVVADGVSGVLVPVGDDRAIADAVMRLIDAPELVQQLGQAARRRALELSWRRCAAETYV